MELDELLKLRQQLDEHQFVPDDEDDPYEYEWQGRKEVLVHGLMMSPMLADSINNEGVELIGQLSRALDELIKLKQAA
jgi:hypothetical protein